MFTGGCMVIEAIGGLFAGSLALLADAAHMLTDTASLGLSYAAMRVALRPATEKLSYGHHRWQVLAAFVNGIALIALAAWIGCRKPRSSIWSASSSTRISVEDRSAVRSPMWSATCWAVARH